MSLETIHFDTLLRNFILHNDPPESWESALEIGSSSLMDNPEFTADFLDYVAQKTGDFDTLESFQVKIEAKNPSIEDTDIRRKAKEVAAKLPSQIMGKRASPADRFKIALELVHAKKIQKHRLQKEQIESLGGYNQPLVSLYVRAVVDSFPEDRKAFFLRLEDIG